jgi:hypothetical protein
MKRSLLAGLGALAFTATLGLAPTAPAEARARGVSADAIADAAPAAYTRYRGYRRHVVYGRRGYPYRYGYYRRNHAGAAVAGAALGLIGGIASAAAASSYYDGSYYGGYYPAGYGYGYGYPSYGYAYPAYSYGYGYPYGGYRRAYWGGGYGGYRRAYWGGGYRGGYGGGWRGGPYGGVRYRSGGWRW